mgnify:CR=1 FL=1
MAEQGQQNNFFKNLVNKLPYQSLDFNNVINDLNPKYNEFQDVGMNRTEALAKNSIFYNNDFNNTPSGHVREVDYVIIESWHLSLRYLMH